MRKTPEILRVEFKPPSEERLEVEVMSIDELRQRAPADHFASLQRADFYRLFGVKGGHTRPMVDFSPYLLQARDWLLVRPGQVMRYDFSRPWTGWLAVFRPDSFFGGPRGTGTGELDLLRRVEDLACLSSVDAAQDRWMDYSLRQMRHDGSLPVDVPVRNEMLRLQLAGTLLRLSVWQTLGSPALRADSGALAHFRRFRQKLEADFADHHQVRHYANALGISEKVLGRACQAGAGLSAKACISRRLALEAKRLLAHTVLPVQSVAHDLGFDEATNFVKFFRKEAGMTPLAFRLAQTRTGA